MKKTNIICTMGPACSDEETLTKMVRAGMNVARFNFSHGTHEEHAGRMALVRKVREKLNAPIALMLDTKGPEYRIKTFREHKVTLNDGDTFAFTADEIEGDERRVSVSYKHLAEELRPGDRILLNNGLVIFEVTELAGADVVCRVLIGGELSDRKSMSFPNKVLKQDYLSEQDKADLLFGIQQDVDFIACSFVSCKQDLVNVREFLDSNGGEHIDLIAKIENRSGVDNIEEIIEHSDGIMVARGDMGVEIPFEELPAIQKHLITACRFRGKRVITATEMLESMIEKPRPTRAEISDVANAVYDGSSAVMLSGESAAGKYPVEAVKTMADICEFTEQHTSYNTRFYKADFRIRNTLDAVSHAVCAMAIDVEAKGIVVCSVSGTTARMVSRFRCPVDIIGMTTDERIYRRLALSWGVTPVLSEEFNSQDVMFFYAMASAKKALHLQKGDRVVLTGGPINGKTGNTNTIKVETV